MTTVCNKDMENRYFLHAHRMNEHGMVHVEDESKSAIPVSLPQYPADLSKIADKAGAFGSLTIRNPLVFLLANGFPKLSIYLNKCMVFHVQAFLIK